MSRHNMLRYINLRWHYMAALDRGKKGIINVDQVLDIFDTFTEDEIDYIDEVVDDYKCDGCHLCEEIKAASNGQA